MFLYFYVSVAFLVECFGHFYVSVASLLNVKGSSFLFLPQALVQVGGSGQLPSAQDLRLPLRGI